MFLQYLNSHALTVQAIAALITAFATLVLVCVTAFYAMQTRNTVKELNRQSIENERKQKVEEAQIFNEVYVKGFKIVSKLMIDEEISEIKKGEKKIIALLFNKHSYCIESEQWVKLQRVHELIYKKIKNGKLEIEDNREFHQNLLNLYEYFYKCFEEMNILCLENSAISKEMFEWQKAVLKNSNET